MGKYLALENCHTSMGRMMPEIRDRNNTVVWPGDIEEIPDAEAAAFGRKHLKPMPANTKVRRYDVDVLKKPKPGKALSTKDKK